MRVLFILLATFLWSDMASQTTEGQRSFLLGGLINYRVQNNTFPLSSLSLTSGLGGIGSVFSDANEDTKNVQYTLKPYLAWELGKTWILGLQLHLSAAKYTAEDITYFGQTDPVDFERKANQYGIGLFGRYLINPDNRFQIYIQANMAYNVLDETEKINVTVSMEEKANFFEADLNPGVSYRVSDNINLLAQFNGISFATGHWEVLDTEIEKDFSSFSLNLNATSIFFGIEFKL